MLDSGISTGRALRASGCLDICVSHKESRRIHISRLYLVAGASVFCLWELFWEASHLLPSLFASDLEQLIAAGCCKHFFGLSMQCKNAQDERRIWIRR